MRKVLKNTAEVFHFWANKVQREGEAASVFFDGDYLFSYGRRFCIARHLPNNTVAFTTRKYSVTTTGHVHAALCATNHLKTVYCNNPSDSALRNMEIARGAIADCLESAERKGIRQTSRDKYRAEALRVAEQANAYLLALPEVERDGCKLIDLSSFESIREHLKVIEEAKRKAEAERLEKRKIELAEACQKWRDGETVYNLYSLPPMLRLVVNAANLLEEVVETSHGARIPVEDALKLWPMILRVKSGNKDYTPGEPVGNYRLTKICSDGSIIVGCHNIAFSEIESIARQLGLLETESV